MRVCARAPCVRARVFLCARAHARVRVRTRARACERVCTHASVCVHASVARVALRGVVCVACCRTLRLPQPASASQRRSKRARPRGTYACLVGYVVRRPQLCGGQASAVHFLLPKQRLRDLHCRQRAGDRCNTQEQQATRNTQRATRNAQHATCAIQKTICVCAVCGGRDRAARRGVRHALDPRRRQRRVGGVQRGRTGKAG
jgi:hypothetical protein